MCDQTTTRCNTKSGENIPECCYNNLKQLMKDSIKIFDKHKLNYWLDWGSLLGIFRDGKLIPYDNDVDFGIFFQDLNRLKATKKDFDDLGYDLCTGHCMGGSFPKIFFSKTNQLYCDVWLWNYCGENQENLGLVRVNEPLSRINRIPKHFYEHLSSIDYEGINIKIPHDPDLYLEFRFGPTWQTPDPHFYRGNHSHSNKIRAEQLRLANIT